MFSLIKKLFRKKPTVELSIPHIIMTPVNKMVMMEDLRDIEPLEYAMLQGSKRAWSESQKIAKKRFLQDRDYHDAD